MIEDNNKKILKVLVGSRAHGLHHEDSDYDYRGVFVIPTTELLKLGPVKKHTSWIEGNVDDSSWEIGKFLFLATKCNPTILETFLSPVVDCGCENPSWKNPCLGYQLRNLFPHIWNSEGVMNAFIGYGLNQRKKFFANPDNRAPKYAVAFLRTLYNAHQLLTTGTFSINVEDSPVFDKLKRYKAGDFEIGDVIQTCYEWQTKVELAYKHNPDKKANLEPVNEFLLKVRKENWL